MKGLTCFSSLFMMAVILSALIIYPDTSSADQYTGIEKIYVRPISLRFNNGYFKIGNTDTGYTPFLRVNADIVITCGEGTMVEAGVFILGGRNYPLIHSKLDSEGGYRSKSFELFTGKEFRETFPTPPEQGLQSNIKVVIEKICDFPDGRPSRIETTRNIPIQYYVEKDQLDVPFLNNADSRVIYSHTCPQGYVIEGTDFRAVHSIKGNDNKSLCIKRQ